MPTIEQARAWYSADDPVHGFDHVLRVYFMAEHLAQVEGAEVVIVRAAALLHDAAVLPRGRRSNLRHSRHTAAELLLKHCREGWPEERISAVQHCIRAHRFRDHSEPPGTLEAQVLYDADKLDALGQLAWRGRWLLQRGRGSLAPPSQKFLYSGTEVSEPQRLP
jgi:uncharacterized protein